MLSIPDLTHVRRVVGAGVNARGRKLWLRGLTASAMLVGASCSGGGGSDESPSSSPVAQQRPTQLSDEQIAAQLYAGSPRTPAGFYKETAPTSYAYVTTAHIKNTDIADVAPSEAQYELCTDDWNQAFAWSETSQQRASQYADLMSTSEDTRFFEFDRVRVSDPQSYLRGRVFKCSYLDRSSNNLRVAASNAGTLHATPLDAPALQSLSEYLWQFTAYNNFGHAVLNSTGSATSTTLSHTLLIANLERHGWSASCDRISIESWRHEVVIATGALTRSVEELWSFGAREVNGAVERCD